MQSHSVHMLHSLYNNIVFFLFQKKIVCGYFSNVLSVDVERTLLSLLNKF